MKGIKKYLFMLMALAAVFGFVACSDDDDDDGPVAVYVAQKNGKYDDGSDYIGKSTFYFYSDGSFERYEYWWDEEDGEDTWPEYKGTYTGEPAKDGEITITVTHWVEKGDEWVPVPESQEEYYSKKITISDGTFTYNDMEFVKQ